MEEFAKFAPSVSLTTVFGDRNSGRTTFAVGLALCRLEKWIYCGPMNMQPVLQYENLLMGSRLCESISYSDLMAGVKNVKFASDTLVIDMPEGWSVVELYREVVRPRMQSRLHTIVCPTTRAVDGLQLLHSASISFQVSKPDWQINKNRTMTHLLTTGQFRPIW